MCDLRQAFQLLLSPSNSRTTSSTYYSYEHENENEQQIQQEEQRQRLLYQLQNEYQQQYRNVQKNGTREGFKSICAVGKDENDEKREKRYRYLKSVSLSPWSQTLNRNFFHCRSRLLP